MAGLSRSPFRVRGRGEKVSLSEGPMLKDYCSAPATIGAPQCQPNVRCVDVVQTRLVVLARSKRWSAWIVVRLSVRADEMQLSLVLPQAREMQVREAQIPSTLDSGQDRQLVQLGAAMDIYSTVWNNKYVANGIIMMLCPSSKRIW